MPSLHPLHFLLLAVTGWANRQQAEAIAYLVAENRTLRGGLPKRVPLTNPERIRLAELGKRLGRKVLKELASIGTPDTILGWYRKHVAAKYDGSAERTPPVAKLGRPPKPQDRREWAARNPRQNPQSLGNELIEPEPALQAGTGDVQCMERLGGLLRFRHRAAA